MPLISGLGLTPITQDRIVICMFGVPIAGIARSRALSVRQFVFGDSELVGFAGLDYEVAAVVLADPAGNGAAEVPWRRPSRTIWPIWSSAPRNWGPLAKPPLGRGDFSCILQQRLHVLDDGGEREGWDLRPVAVERQHVIAPGRPVAEDEDLAPSLGTQIEKFVSDVAQEAGEKSPTEARMRGISTKERAMGVSGWSARCFRSGKNSSHAEKTILRGISRQEA